MRHVKCSKVKRKSTEGDSRRANTKQYFLTVEGRQVQVCKAFFFSTLGTSEQTARTALDKVTAIGTIKRKREVEDNKKHRERERCTCL